MMLPVLWAQDNWGGPITAGPTGSAECLPHHPSPASWHHLLRSDLCSETPGACSIRNSWQSQGRSIMGYKDMKVTVSGGEVEGSPLTKEEAEQLVSIHVLIYCEPGCSQGFSLSGSLYYSVQPQRKKKGRRSEMGEMETWNELLSHLCPQLSQLYVFQIVSVFWRKNIIHLHRDIHNNILDFVQDTGIFVSLSWTLINNLCSSRLWGLCHEYVSLINLASVRLRHPKNLRLHFHSQSACSWISTSGFHNLLSHTPHYDTSGRTEHNMEFLISQQGYL